jgi:hypothetical protein
LPGSKVLNPASLTISGTGTMAFWVGWLLQPYYGLYRVLIDISPELLRPLPSCPASSSPLPFSVPVNAIFFATAVRPTHQQYYHWSKNGAEMHNSIPRYFSGRGCQDVLWFHRRGRQPDSSSSRNSVRQSSLQGPFGSPLLSSIFHWCHCILRPLVLMLCSTFWIATKSRTTPRRWIEQTPTDLPNDTTSALCLVFEDT